MEKTLQLIARGIEDKWTRDRVLDTVVETLQQEHPKYNWVGIYLLLGDMLVLGPYRGKPTVHTRIPIGEGICGLAARTQETVNITDVRTDSRYLACSLETQSELVVPIMDGDTVCGEIDIDSDQLAAFDESDMSGIEQVAAALVPMFRRRGVA